LKKAEVKLNRAYRLVEPGCVVLVTSGTLEKPNVMTFSWQMPVNTSNPCLISLALNNFKGRYSYELIKQNHELVINVPGEELLEETHFAGMVSGKEIDKFKECGLTPIPAKMVKPPLIKECAANLESKVVEIFKMETHDILICEVVRALADSELFDGEYWIPEKFHTLHYLGGKKYGVMTRSVTASADRE